MRPDRPVLIATRLVKRFGATVAVDGIDLSVGAGERVALLGPNGAGKTTTLLMLLGAIDPDGGTVEIAGFHLPRQRSRAMEHVGFVAGYLPLPQHLTVWEALEYFGRLYGLRRPGPMIDEALERFRITALATQRAESLSSGQRTLVGICKAVLHRPALVILDEPTASLDPDVAYRVREGLRSLSDDEGTALLVTSHNMVEVERLCERVAFVSGGRIVAEGTAEEVARRFDAVDLEGVFLELAGTLSDHDVDPAP
jgi:ABC-2 type transport system ATP-binding protein